MKDLIESIESLDAGAELVLMGVPPAPDRPSAANLHRELREAWHRAGKRLRHIREIRVSTPLQAIWLRTIPGFLGAPSGFGMSDDGRWRISEVQADDTRVRLRLVAAARKPEFVDVRRGSHLLTVATASGDQYVGRTVGYVVLDGQHVPVPESQSRRLPNPSTAAASSLRGALVEARRLGCCSDIHLWTPDPLLRGATKERAITRVPQIHRAFIGLVRALEQHPAEVVSHRAHRNGTIAHDIVTRWARLLIAQTWTSKVL